VLVHGLGVSSRYMLPMVRRLAPFGRVWAPDLPGFGRSSNPSRALRLEALTDRLLAWMDEVGIARAVLVGNSVGCQIVAQLAARWPERVQTVVLLGPTMDAGARTRLRQMGRWLAMALREPLSLLLIVALDYLRAGFRRTWRTFLSALADPLEDWLPAIQAPTLVVRGARDRIVSQAWARRIADAVPCGRLVVLPRGAHAVQYDAPDDLLRVLRRFLRLGDSAQGRGRPGRRGRNDDLHLAVVQSRRRLD
jgi:2-hydroxy-6-oxonona-2,4-dienedioate hydrolase